MGLPSGLVPIGEILCFCSVEAKSEYSTHWVVYGRFL